MHKIVCLDGETLYPVEDCIWGRFSDFGDFEVFDQTPRHLVAERIAGADIVLTNKVPVDADTIAACPRLRYIGVLATGYNIVDVKAAGEMGVTVTNIPAYSTASVAQTAISLLLAIVGRVEHYSRENAKGRWSECPDFTYRDFEWHELAGKVFGVVGFGNTGRATAAIAAALGMEIAVYTSKAQSELPEGYVKKSLEDIFRESDVVSLHCPLTPDTANLVNRSTLSLMKPDAVLINTSRGPVVDETALAEALNDGRIAAAGLDVLVNEPPEPSCPLLKAKNCFITPHLAWASKEARRRLFKIALSNVRSFVEGKPQNVVSNR